LPDRARGVGSGDEFPKHAPTAEAHDKAAHLFRALTTAASCAGARAVLEAQGFRVEYVEERWARRLTAVNLEGVRLIDNVQAADKNAAILGLTILTSPST